MRRSIDRRHAADSSERELVLAVEKPVMLRHTWKGDEGEPSIVTWRIDPTPEGSQPTYDHTGFHGIDGIIMSKFVLGPIRRRMLRTGLPPVLDAIDDAGQVRPRRASPDAGD